MGLITADTAAKLLEDTSRTRVLDASWHMPASKRVGQEEFREKHIPGAQFFDVDRVSDRNSPYPHMLPTPEAFGAAMGQLGITRDEHVIVYDNSDVHSAARAFWMLKTFGHAQVSLLDGGLKAWVRGGHQTSSGPADRVPFTVYKACTQPRLVWRYDQVMQNAAEPDASRLLLLDARSHGRFTGKDPEPRPNLLSGHIPHSRNIPFTTVLDAETGMYKSPEALREEFRDLTLTDPMVVSCGSGVSACVVWMGLLEAGATQMAVYDGSWSEYAAIEGSPIVTGEE